MRRFLLRTVAVIGIVVLVLAGLIFIEAPRPNSLIEYQTQNFRFNIPYKFVVPGTGPGQPVPDGFDPEGPEIFIWFPGPYVKEQIPEFSVRGGKGDKYHRNIHVALSDLGGNVAMPMHVGEALSLTGGFAGGFVEESPVAGAFRVYRTANVERLSVFWDLISADPREAKDVSWLGSCHRMADGVETSCNYLVEISGLSANISATEDTLPLLPSITTMIEQHLSSWVVSGASSQPAPNKSYMDSSRNRAVEDAQIKAIEVRLRSYIRPVDGLVGPGLHGYPHRIVPHVATELFARICYRHPDPMGPTHLAMIAVFSCTTAGGKTEG